eukprot:CAMPEP_0177610372 /NCGR_PEP_ID=MMETSP0419_2-20121207/19727_1 /TAXON_ID=582737 /ORGANISM="Tetraselmis sp., Strain GSL018" /LENGTH=394 /DNA_ID=CAMNT_0019105639 /DNA_START=641 /DNA_END=1825 /DNA_ORIENTATION=+
MRDFLGNIPKSSSEIFFRKVKFWDGGHDGEAPPVFNADGITYFHVKSGGVMLVATTKANVSPAMVLELLVRMGSIIKDHIGVLSEEAIRKNFVIVYELLDEAIDYGYPQNASTESLKTFVLNEPSVVASPGMRSASSLFSTPGRHPGVVKSVLDNMKTEATGRKEIFVDVVEKVNVTFSAAGTMHASEVQGSIQVKNYLGHNPPVKIALSSNLLIGRQNTQLGGGWLDSGSPVQLDDCNFNGSCDLSTFEVDRTLQLTPPDGEFAIMNYRSTKDFRPPFRIYTSVEEMSAYKVNGQPRICCRVLSLANALDAATSVVPAHFLHPFDFPPPLHVCTYAMLCSESQFTLQWSRTLSPPTLHFSEFVLLQHSPEGNRAAVPPVKRRVTDGEHLELYL